MILNLSYTSTSDARSCWKKYYYKYIMGLSPKKRTIPMLIGDVIHKCFEMHFKGLLLKDILGYIEDQYVTWIAEEQDHSAIEKLEIAKATCQGMWMSYPLTELDFTDFKPEMEFHTRLAYGLWLKGRVDGLAQKDGRWWIREVKTTSLSFTQFQSKISTSYQPSGYIYGVQKALNIKIEGVAYDIIRRPELRKGANERCDEFCKRIILDYAKPDKKLFYYNRNYVYRSEHEEAEYGTDMVRLGRELRKIIRSNTWYRNTDACWSPGRECQYKRICWTDDGQLDEGMVSAYYTIDNRRVGTNEEKKIPLQRKSF